MRINASTAGLFPSVSVTVGVDGGPALEVLFEVIGDTVSVAVALIEAADTPLVHTGFKSSPVVVEVEGVVEAAEELSAFTRDIIASGAVDVEVVEGAVA